MSLTDWHRDGWVTEHRTSPEEIRNLPGIAGRDLIDCGREGLSPDWRLAIAYNAALQAATAALAASGYRASRHAHHYRVIQSLPLTVGADRRLVSEFDQFRKKRNMSAYDLAGFISDHEADAMAALAERLRQNVEVWLRAHHPDLMA